MDWCLGYPESPTCKKYSNSHLIEKLKGARKKLTPIVDNVVRSALRSKIRDDEHNLNKNLELTFEEYRSIVWASEILKGYQLESNDVKYKLPNANVIVQNVSYGKMPHKTVIVDEELILELLKLYDHMGVIINTMATEHGKHGKPTKDMHHSEITTSDEPESVHNILNKQVSRNSSRRRASFSDEPVRSPSTNRSKDSHKQTDSITEEDFEDTDLSPEETAKSLASFRPELHPIKSVSSTEIHSNEPKSSLSDLLDSSKKNKPKSTTKVKDEEDCEPSIFIKIKCCSKPCESDANVDGIVINCTERCSSNYHVKVNGEPITLKLNQNNAEPDVFCMNTGVECDDEQIKIIIRQCPECKSTVIGSSAGIRDVWGESHESITLHGKQGDESKMVHSLESIVVFTDSHEQLNQDSLKSEPHTELKGNQSRELSRKFDEPRKQNEAPRKQSEAPRKQSEAPMMDVLLDTENVENSTVQVHAEELPPLIRRRLCSSMEFDVSKERTRLRDYEITNKNSKVVLELKALGVDDILRACRPAKCCRKAILDEKQKTALPYCVSLRSLPLMNEDVEVIKQSINMSKRKMKNGPDLSHRETFAYYIGLGEQDFKSNISWVGPVYEIKRSQRNDIFFMLRAPVQLPQQVQSVNKLIKIINNEKEDLKRTSKMYILKKIVSGSLREESVKLRKLNDYMEICHHKQTVYKKNTSTLRNVSEEYIKISSGNKKHRRFRRKSVALPKSHSQSNKFLEGGDFLDSSFKGSQYKRSSTIVAYPTKLNVKNKKKSIVKVPLRKKNKEKKVVVIKSMPSLLKTASEKDLLAKKNRSLERVHKKSLENKKNMQNSVKFSKCVKQTKDKNEEQCLKKVSSAVFSCDKKPKTRTPKNISKSDTEIKTRAVKVQETLRKTTKNKKLKTSLETTKNQLEFYVDLIDGDLVWSNTLPLKPLNYNTYYNHEHESVPEPPLPPGARVPVEDPMNAVRIPPDTPPSRNLLTTPIIEADFPHEEDKITISEITPAHFRLLYENSNETIQGSLKTPAFLSFRLLGPESLDQAWVPFVASEQSLPKFEEVARPKKITELQSEPEQPIEEVDVNTAEEVGVHMAEELTVNKAEEVGVNPIEENYVNSTETKVVKSAEESAVKPAEDADEKPKEENDVKSTEKIDEKSAEGNEKNEVEQKPNANPGRAQNKEKKTVTIKPKSPEESTCSIKEYCVQNNCTNCKSGVCERKKIEQTDAKKQNRDKKKKQEAEKSSKKTLQGVVYINGKAIQSCSKEICELYKNKKMIPDKKPNSSRPRSNAQQRQLTVRPGDRVEIFIENSSSSTKYNKSDEKPEKK